jgi:hypothetical protein
VTQPDTSPATPWPTGLAKPNVVITYTRGTVLGAVRQQVNAEMNGNYGAVVYDGTDPFDYGRQIALVWPSTNGLILIDQDTVVPAGSIISLARCPEPWCMMRIPAPGKPDVYGLGFAKFSADLQRRYPNMARTAARVTVTSPDYSTPAVAFGPRMEAVLASCDVPRHHHQYEPIPGQFHG